jgi:hypothetical protein
MQSVGQGSTFETDRPVELFQMPDQILARGSFAITADGQRVLITSPVTDATSSPVTVVLDWQVALKK